MPTLTWIGKEKVVSHHQDVPYRVLEHKYGFTAENGEQTETTKSGNKIIHGDNLEALKSLLPEYEGKIKCIYIDPPYNTGNESWVYNDNVNHPKIKKWLGEVVGKDGEDLTRHDKWLCMMYPRLKLLHKLLADDGAIFISIDDNEQANLKLICDEIFGLSNFVTCFVVKMSHLSGVKMSHVDKRPPKLKEYLFFYSKNFKLLDFKAPFVKIEWDKAFSRYKSFLIKSEEDPTDITKWKVITLNEAFKKYNINDENDRNDFCIKNSSLIFRTARNRSEQFLNLPNDLLFRDVKTATGLKKYGYKKEEVVFASNKFKNDSIEPTEPLGDIWDDIGINNLHNEGGIQFRNGKKPQKLLERIINMSINKNDIVLDSFAGSGSTAHAVLNLNKLDGGKRKFILIEMEDYAETVTSERVKKVINGFSTQEGTGGAFDFYELGFPLFDENQNLNEQVGLAKIREYIWFSETRTAFNEPNKESYFLGKKDESAYYFIYEKDRLTTLDFDALELIKTKGEQYIIYADNCLLPKEFMAKKNIIFKKIPRDITRF